MGFGNNFKDQEPGIRNKYALLIGANTSNASNAPLIGVTSDLEKFGKILGDSRHSEFEVTSLLNEGFMKVRKEISRISRKAKKDDVVFFYYSGSARLDEQNSLYLLLRDSEESFLDATCLESEFILSQFRKSKCRNFIIIIDCCHSGAFFNNNRGLPKGLFALTACDENETTGENADGGYFSSIIIKGLESDYNNRLFFDKANFKDCAKVLIDHIKALRVKKPSQVAVTASPNISES